MFDEEQYWERYAQNYDEGVEFVVGKDLRRAITEKLRKERGLGETVEFGCGTGYFTEAIAGNAEHVFATDLSDRMLEAARARLKDIRNVTVKKENCESTTFGDGIFDSVLMANVIHIVERPLRALRESHRILKEGGLLFVVSYTDYGTSWMVKIELGMRYFQKFGMPPLYYRNYSPDELARLAGDAGFKTEEVLLISGRANALYLKCRKEGIF